MPQVLEDLDYSVWASIAYRPVLPDLPPHALLAHLENNSTVLDIGCNSGGSSIVLAQAGHQVLGVDINPTAISEAEARKRAFLGSGPSSAEFRVADALIEELPDSFDAVVLIRVLTCFPKAPTWDGLLKKTWRLLRPGGFIYVHDFVLAPDSDVYRSRYAEGVRLGWRNGNFSVKGSDGKMLFIAHHHDQREIKRLREPYEQVRFTLHDSLSMNGNSCRMFEFLGRKPL